MNIVMNNEPKGTIANQLALPFAISAEAKASAASLSAAIEKHNAEVAELADKAKAILGVKELDWSKAHEAESSKLRTRRAELLRQELELRTKIAEYFRLIETVEAPAAHNAVGSEYDAAQRDVQAALASIGFVNSDQRETLRDIASRHPRVKEASLRVDFPPSPPLDAMQFNSAAMDRCRDELAKLKASATAGLA